MATASGERLADEEEGDATPVTTVEESENIVNNRSCGKVVFPALQ